MLAYIKMPAIQSAFELIELLKSQPNYNQYAHTELLIIDPNTGVSFNIFNKQTSELVFESPIEVEYERPIAFTLPLVYDINFNQLMNFIEENGTDKILRLKVNNMLAMFTISNTTDSITYNDFSVYHRNRKFQFKMED